MFISSHRVFQLVVGYVKIIKFLLLSRWFLPMLGMVGEEK